MEKIIKKIEIKILPAIIEIFQDNLVSFVIFGSLAKENFVYKKSDVNIFIITKILKSDYLIKVNKVFKKFSKSIKLAPPLILTFNEIKNSVDIFPIEFSDIKMHHITLYGKDVLNNLKIPDKYLRLELETQIKGKLLLLRESLIKFGNNKKILFDILISSITPIIIILKNLLNLIKAKSISKDDFNIIDEIERRIKLNLNTIKKVLLFKHYRNKVKEDILEVYKSYLSEVESIANYIDKLKVK